MKKNQNPQSIGLVFFLAFGKALYAIAALVATTAVIYSALYLKESKRLAESLLIKEITAQARSAYLAEDVLSIERDLNRFIGAWSDTQPWTTEVRIQVDGKAIARAGANISDSFWVTDIKNDERLASGQMLHAEVRLSSAFYLAKVTIWLILGEAAILLFFYLIYRRLRKSISAIVVPLENTVNWIEQSALQLPNPLSLSQPPSASSIRELGTLQKSVQTLFSEIDRTQIQLTEVHRHQARVELAEQVAHDLRSPVSTLDLLLDQSKSLPSDQLLEMTSAVQRIREIIQSFSLKSQYKNSSALSSPVTNNSTDDIKIQSLDLMVSNIIQEKMVQLRGQSDIQLISLISDDEPIQALVAAVSFQRIISNLIDNSINAVGQSGLIEVLLSLGENIVTLTVKDNGRGISKDVLPRLGKRGESYGRKNGTGLGLAHAQACLNEWGGKLEIKSTIKEGTAVSLVLPAIQLSKEVTELTLSTNSTLVIIDDDPLVHETWKRTLALIDGTEDINRVHLMSPEEAEIWIENESPQLDDTFFLVDYEFSGSDKTGLDLIKNTGIASRATIVSGRADNLSIVSACTNLRVRGRIIKDRIPNIKIKIEKLISQSNGSTVRHSQFVHNKHPLERADNLMEV
jgi:signal transduction histidine kinase